MFYLVETAKDGQRVIVAEDANRSDLEAFADEYHRSEARGPLSYFEGLLRPVRFRASFEDHDAIPTPAPRAKRPAPPPSGNLRSDVTSYLARHPTVSFGVEEIAKEVGAPVKNVRAMLSRLKASEDVTNPDRGKYQHASKETN